MSSVCSEIHSPQPLFYYKLQNYNGVCLSIVCLEENSLPQLSIHRTTIGGKELRILQGLIMRKYHFILIISHQSFSMFPPVTFFNLLQRAGQTNDATFFFSLFLFHFLSKLFDTCCQFEHVNKTLRSVTTNLEVFVKTVFTLLCIKIRAMIYRDTLNVFVCLWPQELFHLKIRCCNYMRRNFRFPFSSGQMIEEGPKGHCQSTAVDGWQGQKWDL